MGHALGLALQIGGVSDFFGSVLDCALLLFPYLRLLDRLSDQLVDDFARGVYTYERMPFQSQNHSSAWMLMMRCISIQSN